MSDTDNCRELGECDNNGCHEMLTTDPASKTTVQWANVEFCSTKCRQQWVDGHQHA